MSNYHTYGVNVKVYDSIYVEGQEMLGTPDSLLYHWTEADIVEFLLRNGFSEQGVYLTTYGFDPQSDWNEDIIWLEKPTRLTINMSQLDPELLNDDEYSEDYPDDNFHYAGAIPASAIVYVKEFEPRPGWKMGKEIFGVASRQTLERNYEGR